VSIGSVVGEHFERHAHTPQHRRNDPLMEGLGPGTATVTEMCVTRTLSSARARDDHTGARSSPAAELPLILLMASKGILTITVLRSNSCAVRLSRRALNQTAGLFPVP
jgi:hypothetical protein